MPGQSIPVSTEIISSDGKHRIVVTYDPSMSRAQRRDLRRAARRKLSSLMDGTWKAKPRKKRSAYRISNIFVRHRFQELPTRFPNPRSGSLVKLGYQANYQNNKLLSKQAVTNGETRTSPRHGRECWDQVNPGPPYQTGGPFCSIEYEVPGAERHPGGSSGSLGNPNNPTGTYSMYNGDYLCGSTWLDDSFGSYPAVTKPANNSLSAYYARAWDQLKPQIPQWNATQFIYELRDLPGMLETTANGFHNAWRSFGGGYSTTFMHPSHIADQFLNEQFGWVPFISDIQKFLDTWDKSGDYISNMVRNNRTWMKRSRVLEESDSTSLIGGFGVADCIPSDGILDWTSNNMCKVANLLGTGSIKGYTLYHLRVTKRIWATGSFLFYRPEFDINDPDFDSGLMTVRRALTQYGFRINPSVLYKITPWTWALDWFTNLGRHIDRLNDFVEDGIVSRNLYVMESHERTMTKTCFLNYYKGPVTLQWQRRLAVKKREVADGPYGFNVPWANISPRQWAILGAIGISRTSSGFISRGA